MRLVAMPPYPHHNPRPGKGEAFRQSAESLPRKTRKSPDSLFSNMLRSSGARYTIEATFPLADAPPGGHYPASSREPGPGNREPGTGARDAAGG